MPASDAVDRFRKSVELCRRRAGPTIEQLDSGGYAGRSPRKQGGRGRLARWAASLRPSICADAVAAPRSSSATSPSIRAVTSGKCRGGGECAGCRLAQSRRAGRRPRRRPGRAPPPRSRCGWWSVAARLPRPRCASRPRSDRRAGPRHWPLHGSARPPRLRCGRSHAAGSRQWRPCAPLPRTIRRAGPPPPRPHGRARSSAASILRRCQFRGTRGIFRQAGQGDRRAVESRRGIERFRAARALRQAK